MDMPLMSRAEWQRRLHVGLKMRCTYRWYWEQTPSKKPESGTQFCIVDKVMATQLTYRVDGEAESRAHWLHFPKASELIATTSGFEMYFPTDEKWGERSGKLMSRYQFVGEGR